MNRIRPQWGNMLIGFALVGAVWYFWQFHWMFLALLVLITIAANLFAGPVGNLIWGLGLIALGTLAYFYYGSVQWRLAAGLGAIGLVYVVIAVMGWKRRNCR